MRTFIVAAALLAAFMPTSKPDTIAFAHGASSVSRPRTYAVYYSPGVMERVSRVRGLPLYKYMASVPDCSRIGQWVKASVNGHVRWFRVTDCSAPWDRPRHLATGLTIEVNYAAAREFGFLRRGRAPAYIISWSE